ncbi:MAG: PDZ domain-containing protein [Verrucomicrobia bacterium]|nr:PDZ domain-containing protein [Verrucomicrobiota bacterium]MCH8510754.1 PDZ domain-containing protein [Kiritimatiellia bacterium]
MPNLSVLLFFILATNAPALPLRAQEERWTRNEAMLTFFEALRAVEDHAVEPHTLAELVESSLRELLPTLDPHAEYLSAAEMEKRFGKPGEVYGGVGMELRLTEAGVSCFPYPDSPAERAGIREGDILVAVDLQDVKGMNPRECATLIRGPLPSQVHLTVRTRDNETRKLNVLRQQINPKTVVLRKEPGEALLRVYTFNASTPGEFRRLVKGVAPEDTLIVDLRGNQGGSLYDAVDIAAFFLPEGREILTVHKRDGSRIWKSPADGPFVGRRVVLLQDENSASAAEVLLAALTRNGAATSIGARSLGKGTTQQLFPLSTGGAILLTDGTLEGPGGLNWNNTGLPPDIPLPDFNKSAWGAVTLSDSLPPAFPDISIPPGTPSGENPTKTPKNENMP